MEKMTRNMETLTKEMNELAKKTKQETVSMRIITLVTLFFLPGTFISVGACLMLFAKESSLRSLPHRQITNRIIDNHEYRYYQISESKWWPRPQGLPSGGSDSLA